MTQLLTTGAPMSIPLAPVLHALAQALLYPVLASLLLAAVYLAYEVGLFLAEWRGYGSPGRAAKDRIRRMAGEARSAEDPVLVAERLLAAEELRLQRRVERTDLLVRLGPALGLAGTLIPLGPGLAALGRGEVQSLAAALTVAFDTTVVGVLIGALAFVLSSVRRRWYEAHALRVAAGVEDALRGDAGLAAPAPAGDAVGAS